MSAFIIIICALLLGFVEKPHLFQKPYKWEKILIAILLVVTAFFSGWKEWDNDIQQNAAKQTIDSLHGESKALLMLIDTLRNDNRTCQISYSEQLSDQAKYYTQLVSQYGSKVDTFAKNVMGKETPPTLTIYQLPTIDTSTGETVFSYDLRAINANAHLQGYYYVLINTHTSKGQEVLETPMVFGGATMNFTSIIVPNEIKGVSVFLDRAPKASDDCFIAMEFGYKSKGNKQQTPLRKIYYIYDKKTKVREVDSSTFYAISLLLRENKIWEKFYSL